MFSFPNTLYAITDERIAGLDHVQQVERLIAGGAKLIQLREKQLPAREFYEIAVRVVALARPHGVRIIINDRVDIALAVQAAGVHLGQTDLTAIAARQLLGQNAVIGFSTHNPDQVKAAAKLPIDYLAFGPIFPTHTKENRDPVVGIDLLRQIRRLVPTIPLVAIGSISLSNASQVLDAGADAVAMIRALLDDDSEITSRTARFLSSQESMSNR